MCFFSHYCFPSSVASIFLSPLSFSQSSGSQPGPPLPPGDGICDGHVIRKRATSVVEASDILQHENSPPKEGSIHPKISLVPKFRNSTGKTEDIKNCDIILCFIFYIPFFKIEVQLIYNICFRYTE